MGLGCVPQDGDDGILYSTGLVQERFQGGCTQMPRWLFLGLSHVFDMDQRVATLRWQTCGKRVEIAKSQSGTLLKTATTWRARVARCNLRGRSCRLTSAPDLCAFSDAIGGNAELFGAGRKHLPQNNNVKGSPASRRVGHGHKRPRTDANADECCPHLRLRRRRRACAIIALAHWANGGHYGGSTPPCPKTWHTTGPLIGPLPVHPHCIMQKSFARFARSHLRPTNTHARFLLKKNS